MVGTATGVHSSCGTYSYNQCDTAMVGQSLWYKHFGTTIVVPTAIVIQYFIVVDLNSKFTGSLFQGL